MKIHILNGATVDAFCTRCVKEVRVQPDLLCPQCGNEVDRRSLPVVSRSDGPASPSNGAGVPDTGSGGGIAASNRVALPAIREATAWDAATDSLLSALEREEAEALAAFEAARDRVKEARRAAAALRQLRGMVSVRRPPPSLKPSKATRTVRTVQAKALPAPGTRPWSREHACCVNCGSTSSPHQGHGRCGACAMYFRTHGVERPGSLWAANESEDDHDD